MSTNPKIVALTDEFFPIISEFLIRKKEEESRSKVSEVEIHEHLREQQEQGKVEGLTFRYRTENLPHSIQVYHVITNLVRMGRLEESGHLIGLSTYGRSLMS